MRESGTSNLTCEGTLQSTDLVFQVLSLLAECAFGRLRPYRFDGVTDALDFVSQSIAHNREVRRECAIVVDKQHVGEFFRSVASNILSNNLATNGAPNVVDPVLTTYFFRVIQRYRAITICDDKDVLRWKYLLRGHERGPDNIGGFVLLVVSIPLSR